MKKFLLADCPEDLTMFQWISKETYLDEARKDIKCSVDIDDVISIPHTLDITKIITDTKECLAQHGFKGWTTQRGDANSYGGLSLVYNPDLVEDKDPNQSTLGTTTNTPAEFFYGSTQRFNSIRNTYFDSYGFRKLSPCVVQSNMKSLLDEFRLSPTRSRIGVLDATYHSRVGEEFLWHKDETVFENLRLNIPIETDESFLFQLENKDPIHLAVGHVYTWNTNLPHRVYATEQKDVKRTHIVFGFSPWLDYINDEDAFVVNEFFGKIHPIDIFLNGLAHDKIGLKHG